MSLQLIANRIANRFHHPNISGAAAFMQRVRRLYYYEQPRRIAQERRKAERIQVSMRVCVTPLDENNSPMSHKTAGITRDLSELGAGLILPNPISPSMALLEFEPNDSRPFSIKAKICYCIEDGLYFRTGCQFVE